MESPISIPMNTNVQKFRSRKLVHLPISDGMVPDTPAWNSPMDVSSRLYVLPNIVTESMDAADASVGVAVGTEVVDSDIVQPQSAGQSTLGSTRNTASM